MMTQRLFRSAVDEQGFSLAELLVAIGIFVLLVLTIDAVFITVNRSSRTTELAADVAQNGRVAIERLTREVRFSSASSSSVCPPASPGTATLCWGSDGTWVAFKSARLPSNPTVFCVDAANTQDELYVAACSPPLTGTYMPVWQRWIVYWLETGGRLRRSVQTDVTVAPSNSGGDVIATAVSSFNVSLSGTVLTATLVLAATERVQGSNVPTQRITLTSETYIRD